MNVLLYAFVFVVTAMLWYNSGIVLLNAIVSHFRFCFFDLQIILTLAIIVIQKKKKKYNS